MKTPTGLNIIFEVFKGYLYKIVRQNGVVIKRERVMKVDDKTIKRRNNSKKTR